MLGSDVWGPYVVVFILALVFLLLVLMLIPKKPPQGRFDWFEYMDQFGEEEEKKQDPKKNYYKIR